MEGRWNWRGAARCRAAEAEGLFVTGSMQREARQVCLACPVRTECLGQALDNRIEFGVWGGMTERERRALLRSRPEVRSWTDLLTEARAEHYGAAHTNLTHTNLTHTNLTETGYGSVTPIRCSAEEGTAEHLIRDVGLDELGESA